MSRSGSQPRVRDRARPVDKSETRRRLLEAAAEVIARKGLQGASLMDIAREAGVTTGAIYSSFRNKEELLFAVVDELTPTLVGSELAAAGTELATISSVTELARAAGRYSDDPRARRLLQLQLELFSLALREPVVLQTFVRDVQAATQAVVELVQKQMDAKAPPPPLPAPTVDQVAAALIAVIQGLMLQRVLGAPLSDDVFEWVAHVVTRAASEPRRSRKR